MKKIVKVDESEVEIKTDSDSIIKVDRNKFNFSPEVDDEVEIFGSGTDIVVNKVGVSRKRKIKGFINFFKNSEKQEQVFYLNWFFLSAILSVVLGCVVTDVICPLFGVSLYYGENGEYMSTFGMLGLAFCALLFFIIFAIRGKNLIKKNKHKKPLKISNKLYTHRQKIRVIRNIFWLIVAMIIIPMSCSEISDTILGLLLVFIFFVGAYFELFCKIFVPNLNWKNISAFNKIIFILATLVYLYKIYEDILYPFSGTLGQIILYYFMVYAPYAIAYLYILKLVLNGNAYSKKTRIAIWELMGVCLCCWLLYCLISQLWGSDEGFYQMMRQLVYVFPWIELGRKMPSISSQMRMQKKERNYPKKIIPKMATIIAIVIVLGGGWFNYSTFRYNIYSKEKVSVESEANNVLKNAYDDCDFKSASYLDDTLVYTYYNNKITFNNNDGGVILNGENTESYLCLFNATNASTDTNLIDSFENYKDLNYSYKAYDGNSYDQYQRDLSYTWDYKIEGKYGISKTIELSIECEFVRTDYDSSKKEDEYSIRNLTITQTNDESQAKSVEV